MISNLNEYSWCGRTKPKYENSYVCILRWTWWQNCCCYCPCTGCYWWGGCCDWWAFGTFETLYCNCCRCGTLNGQWCWADWAFKCHHCCCCCCLCGELIWWWQWWADWAFDWVCRGALDWYWWLAFAWFYCRTFSCHHWCCGLANILRMKNKKRIFLNFKLIYGLTGQNIRVRLFVIPLSTQIIGLMRPHARKQLSISFS